ncbi:MAG: hypothetical protein AAF755_10350 [Pseudomonadota bacterium]
MTKTPLTLPRSGGRYTRTAGKLNRVQDPTRSATPAERRAQKAKQRPAAKGEAKPAAKGSETGAQS